MVLIMLTSFACSKKPADTVAGSWKITTMPRWVADSHLAYGNETWQFLPGGICIFGIVSGSYESISANQIKVSIPEQTGTAGFVGVFNIKTSGTTLTLTSLSGSEPVILDRTELPKPTQIQKPTPDPILQEAIKQTDPLWIYKWTLNGDSWFSMYPVFRGQEYIQGRKLTYNYKLIPVSAVDKLNGIEWMGRIYCSFEFRRIFDPVVGKWRDWIDRSSGDSTGNKVYKLTKKHGKWEIVDEDFFIKLEKPTAEKISELLK